MRSVRDAAVCGGSGAGRDHRCDQSLHISTALTLGMGETRFVTRGPLRGRACRGPAHPGRQPRPPCHRTRQMPVALLRPIPEAAPVTSATAP